MAGGKIVVYTGIIDSLKLTDAQLAAVIGHEISHALREHSREQVSRAKLKNVGTAAVSELFGLNSAEQTVVNLAAEALSLKYSRSQETEADNMGTELMARAGYDPNEAVKVWEKMSALSKSSTPEFMSTHPSHETRIENLKEISDKVYPLYQKRIKYIKIGSSFSRRHFKCQKRKLFSLIQVDWTQLSSFLGSKKTTITT